MRWIGLPFPPEYLAAPKTPGQASQIHARLLAGGALSPFLATKLIELYASSAPTAATLLPALRLLSSLHIPNTFSFTALLHASSRLGSHALCLRLYSSMRRSSILPDPLSLPPALRSSSSPAALHADAIKSGASPEFVANTHLLDSLVSAYARVHDLRSAHKSISGAGAGAASVAAYNCLISAYTAAGSMDDAVDLLSTMRSGEIRPIPCPSVVSWTTVMAGYARRGDHTAALQIFREMIHESGGVPPDGEALACAISSCRRLSDPRLGCECHAFGIKAWGEQSFYRPAGSALVVLYAGDGRLPAAALVFRAMDLADVVTWNAVILALARAGMAAAAMERFMEMHERGVAGDGTTMATVLGVCDLDCGAQIHAHALRRLTVLPPVLCNALMAMYARHGRIATARSVFSTAADQGDVVAWNTMIAALGSNGEAAGVTAVGLVREMELAEVQPDGVTLANLMACLGRNGSLEDEGAPEALEMIGRKLSAASMPTTVVVAAAAADMLGRAGRAREAVGVARGMGGKAAWGAALAACSAGGERALAMEAFEEAVQAEPDRAAGSYIAMADMCAAAGRWEEAYQMRTAMERKGVAKPSACSWIGVRSPTTITTTATTTRSCGKMHFLPTT